MRVAIDVRKLHDFGIGTYVRNLIRQLARIDHDTEYLLLCRPDDIAITETLGSNFRAIPHSAANYSLTEQLSVPISLGRNGANLFHAPHYVLPPLTPCRSVVTIHDCIHLRFPQYLPNRLASRYAWTQGWLATRRARLILTVSETSKKDIIHYFDVAPENIVVIPNAIDDHFSVAPSQIEMHRVRQRYQLPKRFVMYAGNVKPHKNLERLIDAFAVVRQRGFSDLGLLVSGSEVSRYATLRRAVHRYGLHKHVRFLGFQSETTLAVLYRLAEVFVIPSLYEGFGLSPLEALASGTPVVASNVSSLPEVLGDAALLVDPYDPQSIAAAMTKLLDDKELRAKLIQKGYARSRLFSWEQSVRRVHEIYRQVGEGL